MHSPSSPALSLRARNLLFLTRGAPWPAWPFLPLVRRQPGQAEEYGVLFDAMTSLNLPGYSATVFLSNLFEVPAQLPELLAMPRETFDTAEEIYAAGWRID